MANRRSELELAFDAAIAQTRRYLSTGMTAANGQSARPRLEELERDLRLQRDRASETGAVDQQWLQATVRSIVNLLPASELTLIAALGRIARLKPRSTS
jgi:hypothetical protein